MRTRPLSSSEKVPEVDSIVELNRRLEAIDAAEDARIVIGAPVTIGQAFAVEARLLRPLPEDEFDAGITLTPTVANTSRISIRQCYYSVPARFIGRKVRVSLRANEVLVFDGRHVIARHPRIKTRGDCHDNLDHYLEVLLAKPGALAGSSALAQARLDGAFTPSPKLTAHHPMSNRRIAEWLPNSPLPGARTTRS